jgi:CHAT domain-containing protein
LSAETQTDWRTLGLGVSSEETVADPISDNKKLKFPALPGVPRELEAIVRDAQTADQAGATVGKKFVDADFNRKNFSESLTKETEDGKRQFTVVHVASHFYLGGTTENSFLLLGEGKILTLAQISNSPEITFEGVELVTLSACNTAFGNDKTGEEVDSLATFIISRGAKSVMATLWAVADDSTWQLMSEFYRLHKADPNTSKSELIRQAQLNLLKGAVKNTSSQTRRSDFAGEIKDNSANLPPFQYDEKKPFAHPYYWSPFVLIGNWR